MLETLAGTLFGGLFRLAPEILKWLDRQGDREHELAMLDRQIALDHMKGDQAQALARIEADKGIGIAELQAMMAGAQAQAVQTGVRWVDAFNSLIRPLMALQWVILLWPAVVVASFCLAVDGGTEVLEALKGCFGTEEKAMASSIASFWLMDRSLRKGAFK